MEDSALVYLSCNDRLPKPNVCVDAIIKNTGGGVTTYELTTDTLLESGTWLDGDGKLARTTIAWRER